MAAGTGNHEKWRSATHVIGKLIFRALLRRTMKRGAKIVAKRRAAAPVR
jgi:hypothetical protein